MTFKNNLMYVKEISNRTTFDAEEGKKIDDSYIHTAQKFNKAVKQIMDVAYDYNHFVPIYRFIAGPSASMYLRLNCYFEQKGKEEKKDDNTEYQIGELFGIPVFKILDKDYSDDVVIVTYKDKENQEGLIGLITIENIRKIA